MVIKYRLKRSDIWTAYWRGRSLKLNVFRVAVGALVMLRLPPPRVVLLVVALVASLAISIGAQAPKPTFEVASVKRNQSTRPDSICLCRSRFSAEGRAELGEE